MASPANNVTSVIVVGAGAAGLAATRTLLDGGITDVVILEATDQIGGRIRRTDEFDFPIDLGGQWIHPVAGESVSDILTNLLSGPTLQEEPKVPFDTIAHEYDPVQVWNGNSFYNGFHGSQDHLFVNYTWFDFLNDNYFAAGDGIRDVVEFSCAVNQIDTTGSGDGSSNNDTVTVTCTDGRAFIADCVILTPSIKVLQDELIRFVPPLPSNVTGAIKSYTIANAVKIFVEFSTKFYPDAFLTEQDCQVSSDGNDRLFWSESFGEDANANILGVFAIGTQAGQYSDVSDDDEALRALLATQIDEMFGTGMFADNYVRHVVQDWSMEPYARGAYTTRVSNFPVPLQVLSSSVANGKLWFAGEALPPDGNYWGFVHTAAYSGQRAANIILDGKENVMPISSSTRVALEMTFALFSLVIWHL